MYVLDTNVLSALAHKRPNPKVVDWVGNLRAPIAIPFSAVFEIQRGISMLKPKDAQRAASLAKWLKSLLESDVIFLAMDAPVAQLYADMTLVPALQDLWVPCKHAKKPGQDLAIAATAIAHRAVVASMNTKDFVRIDRYFRLRGLFNPDCGKWDIPLASARRSSAAQTHEKEQQRWHHRPLPSQRSRLFPVCPQFPFAQASRAATENLAVM
ncbi:PIN domain-containing protein [Mesorhizobium sp. B2-4-19]|uniref:PIN domain-containing protein n=1 Tax=Mesorhizobium sp. B2-4-19 TaxID=2589930 RepID=UPI0015E482CD|nr:PIN domain-containing protein [Mesorhizobium sp. B2-4-19]